jgi:hypothetical protein
MRLNSSIDRTNIPQSESPFGGSTCVGARPFIVNSLPTNGSTRHLGVCVPGNFKEFPWTLSRNRQDITEYGFFHIGYDRGYENNTYQHNINRTLRCTARTTRGYFELPNQYNNYTHEPLKE